MGLSLYQFVSPSVNHDTYILRSILPISECMAACIDAASRYSPPSRILNTNIQASVKKHVLACVARYYINITQRMQNEISSPHWMVQIPKWSMFHTAWNFVGNASFHIPRVTPNANLFQELLQMQTSIFQELLPLQLCSPISWQETELNSLVCIG